MLCEHNINIRFLSYFAMFKPPKWKKGKKKKIGGANFMRSKLKMHSNIFYCNDLILHYNLQRLFRLHISTIYRIWNLNASSSYTTTRHYQLSTTITLHVVYVLSSIVCSRLRATTMYAIVRIFCRFFLVFLEIILFWSFIVAQVVLWWICISYDYTVHSPISCTVYTGF